MDTGLYLFCFARPDTPAIDAPGLDSHSSVTVRRYEPAAAVVGQVELEDFCGPEGERNLAELAWVGPRACRHEEVIEAVMRQSPVLPARFGTIFSGAARLEDFVRRHGAVIATFLARVAGQEEWAVKALLDREAALAWSCSGKMQARLAGLAPGRRHLEEQKLRTEADALVGRSIGGICGAVADALRSHAAEFTERRILGGAPSELIANWALLAPAAERATLEAEVARANREHGSKGLAFQFSGPWPPYSFAPALALEPER